MILNLKHTKLPVFQATRLLAVETYKIARDFPDYERFGMISQLRRAALSVHLNIAEGCSRKSQAERKRYFEVARGSLIEVDSCLDLAVELNYCKLSPDSQIGKCILNCFKQISAMIPS